MAKNESFHFGGMVERIGGANGKASGLCMTKLQIPPGNGNFRKNTANV